MEEIFTILVIFFKRAEREAALRKSSLNFVRTPFLGTGVTAAESVLPLLLSETS
jgi:hypothetical protein